MTQEIVKSTNGSATQVAGSQIHVNTAISNLVEKAMLNHELDMDRLQQVLDFQERILNKQAEAEYNEAHAVMIGELPKIHKAKTNSHTKSSYASLEEIHAAILPVLSKHGFSVSYRTNNENGIVSATAILAHKGGHKEQNTVCVPLDTQGAKNPVQAVGSSLTYAQRYALCGLLSLTLTHDDDANATSEPITHEQATSLDQRLRKSNSNINEFLKFMKVNSIQEIKARDYAKADNAISSKEKGVGK